ncbi:MAG: hypothetical protein WC742_13085 [Gallionellaceae bacterium]|jgi:hypothetical protein
MLRRELFIRMLQGEKLIGSSMKKSFVLDGSASARDRVSPEFLDQLIADGLVEPVVFKDKISVVTTSKIDDWFRKRGINRSRWSLVD